MLDPLRLGITATMLLTGAISACWAQTATVAPHTSVARLPPVISHRDASLAGLLPAPSSATPTHQVRSKPVFSNQPFVTPERLEHGYTIVAVGVNGDNALSSGLAPGLAEGGYRGAVEVVDWTTSYWPLFLYHLRSGNRHRSGAQAIAEKIARYQTDYPGREVNLVGYSAGAVVAVQAVEALGRGREVDRVILLAGAISPLYDLRPTLRRTRVGVWNYYQPQDVVALMAGTVVAGTADGQHIASAGAVGFWPRLGLSGEEQALYRHKLVQLPYHPRMAVSGNLGGHFQCVGRKFVASWISPLLSEERSARVVARAGAHPAHR